MWIEMVVVFVVFCGSKMEFKEFVKRVLRYPDESK